MKKILITGKNSYIGGMFKKWVEQWPDEYKVVEISVRGEEWKKADFSPYDSVFHVAGIAHNSSNPKLKDKYYQVNRDLTIEVAKKAKAEGVKQFIFMSSIIVYGTKNEFIDENTEPDPDNFYGDSKLQAENGLQELESASFNAVILRPPMIYGGNSKGNYPLLSKYAKKIPVFPDYPNKRSMLYIDNFCEFLKLMILNNESGTFHPQNKELVQTSEMVKLIARKYNHRIWFTKLGNPIISLFFKGTLIKKIFGDLYYEKSMSEYKKEEYQLVSFSKSITLTENNS